MPYMQMIPFSCTLIRSFSQTPQGAMANRRWLSIRCMAQPASLPTQIHWMHEVCRNSSRDEGIISEIRLGSLTIKARAELFLIPKAPPWHTFSICRGRRSRLPQMPSPSATADPRRWVRTAVHSMWMHRHCSLLRVSWTLSGWFPNTWGDQESPEKWSPQPKTPLPQRNQQL